ncbi:uncharacterized protein LOC110240677 [Exaiptasia diaphana]|uniref:Uncharacterized protein n=1 Tax=Exaiptasia diaphana TaxID=2652724 RepID=A0A913XBZ9_EXADI|nr:uncharacterized protein LOC110240677 [Exaiptasia diaphana]XP_020902148.1 uncharacterized protein LOC110240677 [Exaiptasia diaphana]KXJ13252.1 hypothetical protein AC249_AIPGENE23866 [Exaiptasia diaphana]
MAFEVRGEPQTVQHIDGEDTMLHDPLLVTVLDFNRRALDQLAHALHLTVKRTYNHAPGIDKGNFFKGRDGRGVNPSQDSSGRDVYHLLNNMKSHVDLYADHLEMEEDTVLEQTVEFLLETIRNGMAHQTYLGCTGDPESNNSCACELKKNDTTEKCLRKCNELLTWIIHAKFYKVIRSKIRKILDNINNMNGVFEDFKNVKKSLKENPHYATDTERALKKLDKVREALEEEENCDDSIDERPLTHFVNMVMLPRLKEIRD